MKYYPVEYIAAMLNSVMGIPEKVAYYTRFAESLGIQVLPPDINESFSRFTVKENTIRFGLAAIRNVGLNVVEAIVKARNEKGIFKSLLDFCQNIDITQVNKRAIESLIKAGAFDSFKVFRSQMIAVYEKIMDGVSNDRKKNLEGQISFFALTDEPQENLDIKFPNIKEFEKRHKLAMEKEMTGLYITGHPLEDYVQSLKFQTSTTIGKIMSDYKEQYETLSMENEDEEYQIENATIDLQMGRIKDGQRVKIGGIISDFKRKITRSNSLMAFVKLEDLTDLIECLVFPKTYERIAPMIETDSMVVIEGRVSMSEDEEPKIMCENIFPLEKIDNSKLYIAVEDEEVLKGIRGPLRIMVENHKGNTPTYVFVRKDKKSYRMSGDYWVTLDDELIEKLKDSFGEANIKIVE